MDDNLAVQDGGSRLKAVLNYAFVTLCVALIAAMFFAFALGGYTVFSSGLGGREAANPIILLPIFVLGAPIPLFSSASLADVFGGLWTVYLILFAIALNGPRRSLLAALRKIGETGRFRFYDNTALTIAASFSILMVVFLLIEYLQALAGIPTGVIPENPPIRSFTLMSWAPISEEIGFRMTLIGGVAVIALFSRGLGLRALKALWHPSRVFEDLRFRGADYIPLMYFAIAISSLFFGAAHIAYESSWEIGKLSTATIAGFVIGWLYFRMGFPAAVLLHWSFNFLSGAYVYFACALTAAVGRCEEVAEMSPLVNAFEVLVVTTGVLAIGLLVLNRLSRQ